MATYKVPQDVEAEDKLLGPLTLKQFIYAIIVFLGLWLTIVFARNPVTLFLIPIPLLPALFFAFMIFLGIKNPAQTAESYLAAIVRFYFKPHKRIWNQDGVIEPVQITAPPKPLHQYTDNLSQAEVRSRLSRLSSLMDSRGWAAKDVRFQPNIVLPMQPGDEDDRLISISQLPQTQLVEPTDVHASDDVMDEQASPVAQHFDAMLIEQQQTARDQAIAHMQDPNYNPYPTDMRQKVLRPLTDATENRQARASKQAFTDSQQPPSSNQQLTGIPESVSRRVTSQNPIPQYQAQNTAGVQSAPAPSPAIAQLAQNDDLSVQTIQNEAQRLQNLESGEEISLH